MHESRPVTTQPLQRPPPEAVREMQQLLGGAGLSLAEGRLIRGQAVHLLLTVWDSTSKPDLVDVVLSAFRPGAPPWPLDRVPMWARAHTPQGAVCRPGQSAGLGAVKFCGLPRWGADYHLHVLAAAGAGSVPLPAACLAARTCLAEATIQELRRGKIYPSQDGNVLATLRQTESGELMVAVETRVAEFGGAVVEFAFLDGGTGRVICPGSCTLRPATLPGLWEGRTTAEVFPAGVRQCEFLYGIGVSPLAVGE
jgi:hypothetical protein